MTTALTTQTVLDNVDLFLNAIHVFRTTATDLMGLLAQHLNVPLTAFADHYFRFQLDFSQYEGTLQNGWTYWFHGFECQFTHPSTGQTLDVKLGYADEFGVLDTHFFFRFIATTAALQAVARLIPNEYSDLACVLTVLVEHGYLRRIVSATGKRSGVISVNR